MSEESTAVAVKKPIEWHEGSGLRLASFEEAWRFAQCVSASGLAPKGMEKPEAIVVAIQMGAEVGLSPMASLQNIAVINGRPSIWGDAMLAICRASGLFDESAFSEDCDGKVATCTVRRKPDGKVTARSFSLDDAKKAGLIGKAGPWSQYEKRMLQMRARSWALRDTFSDILRGLRSYEEEVDCVDVRPAKQTAIAPPDGLEGEAL